MLLRLAIPAYARHAPLRVPRDEKLGNQRRCSADEGGGEASHRYAVRVQARAPRGRSQVGRPLSGAARSVRQLVERAIQGALGGGAIASSPRRPWCRRPPSPSSRAAAACRSRGPARRARSTGANRGRCRWRPASGAARRRRAVRFVVDAAVGEHLEILQVVALRCIRLVEAVQHAGALHRRLLDAVHRGGFG
jgi:hypothetical protein